MLSGTSARAPGVPLSGPRGQHPWQHPGPVSHGSVASPAFVTSFQNQLSFLVAQSGSCLLQLGSYLGIEYLQQCPAYFKFLGRAGEPWFSGLSMGGRGGRLRDFLAGLDPQLPGATGASVSENLHPENANFSLQELVEAEQGDALSNAPLWHSVTPSGFCKPRETQASSLWV